MSGVMRPAPPASASHVDRLAHAAHRLEDVRDAEAPGQRGLRGLLDDGSVHDRVGVGQAELEHVDAVAGHRDRRVDARVEIGEADGQVAHERAAALPLRHPDRGCHR
jgi:hypothetical protein